MANTIEDIDGLMVEVRERFMHIDSCPFGGERIFFENAGGALTLKSVVQTSARFAAIPDNQGRDNPASQALVSVIAKAKQDMRDFLGPHDGEFFVGETGTELLFRVISAAVLGTPPGGRVISSTLEHPATRSAAARWSQIAGKPHVVVPHDIAAGSVSWEDYAPEVTPDTRVAIIIHTSPVTGMGVDVGRIARKIRERAPGCFIVVDGIQHAAHGGLSIGDYDIDAYVVSPYKMFSRHGYGLAWISDRLRVLPHDRLIGGPEGTWELGTRDTGSYATFSDVVEYYDWLGSNFTDAGDRKLRIEAAGRAIAAQEKSLTDAMLYGTGNLAGLAEIPGVGIVGGADNPRREGLVSFWVEGHDSAGIVSALAQMGVRVHTRKNDHYSGNILSPMGLDSCIRVSACHYNTTGEIVRFLGALTTVLAS